MKNVLRFIIPFLMVGSSLGLGQRALELEQQVPNWQSGEMTLYFDMAVYPEVNSDGSFTFGESMDELTEMMALFIEIGDGYSFEDLYPWCYDDDADNLAFSADEVGYWGFRTARLNQRTDGTNDGTVELQAEGGGAFTFIYADRPVEVTGSCQLNEDVTVEFDLELVPEEVRYVLSKAVDRQFSVTTDVTQEDIEAAEWVFELN